MEETHTTSSSLVTFLLNENTSVYGDSMLQNISNYYNNEEQLGRLIILVFYPVIIMIGMTGNILTFFVMRRGSLKQSSTCFYMAVLALSDASK